MSRDRNELCNPRYQSGAETCCQISAGSAQRFGRRRWKRRWKDRQTDGRMVRDDNTLSGIIPDKLIMSLHDFMGWHEYQLAWRLTNYWSKATQINSWFVLPSKAKHSTSQNSWTVRFYFHLSSCLAAVIGHFNNLTLSQCRVSSYTIFGGASAWFSCRTRSLGEIVVI